MQVFAVFEHKTVRRAGIEPDVENIEHLFVIIRAVIVAEKTRRIGGEPCIRSFFANRRRNPLLNGCIAQQVAGFLIDEYRDWHAPRTLAGHDPVGPSLDHAMKPGTPCLGIESRRVDGVQRDLAQSLAFFRERLVHRNKPLRRITENKRLLGAPRMRILMLHPAARDQRICANQRINNRLVGIALLALFGDDAFTVKTRRFVGINTVGVDCIGNTRFDTACRQTLTAGNPDIIIVPSMTGRRMHKARTGVIHDM